MVGIYMKAILLTILLYKSFLFTDNNAILFTEALSFGMPFQKTYQIGHTTHLQNYINSSSFNYNVIASWQWRMQKISEGRTSFVTIV